MPRDLEMCTCGQRHECTGLGGFQYFMPTFEWLINRELQRLAKRDRNLWKLLDDEKTHHLSPARSEELRQQRKTTTESYWNMAEAAMAHPWAGARCKLSHNAAVERALVVKGDGRTDKENRRMM